MDFPVFRVKPEYLLVVIVGLVQPALNEQGVTEVVVCPGMVGVELKGLLVVGDRLVQSALSLQGKAEVVVGPGIVGVELECHLVVVDRLAEVPSESQGVADGAVANSLSRPTCQRGPVVAACFPCSAAWL